jgi:hypothetical protein
VNPQPSRLIHGQGTGRTQVVLDGVEPLLVTEPLKLVKAQIVGGDWAVLTLDDEPGSTVEVRSSCVAALIDLEHHGEEDNVRHLRRDNPAA